MIDATKVNALLQELHCIAIECGARDWGLPGFHNNPGVVTGLYADKLRAAVQRWAQEMLRAQLPEGMEHCTIQFRQCVIGHGWLTADNWIDHGCPTCAIVCARASSATGLRGHLHRVISDEDLRAAWRVAGGEFHGPKVETATIPESALLPLLRSLLASKS